MTDEARIRWAASLSDTAFLLAASGDREGDRNRLLLWLPMRQLDTDVVADVPLPRHQRHGPTPSEDYRCRYCRYPERG